eukprot:s1270_g1.t1
MADRRSRSRDSLQADQRPQRRDECLIVDLMHLMNCSADDVDRFQSLRCLRAGLRSDETVAAFSYFELIPFRRLGDFLVDDLAEKVCKRFESHTGVTLNPHEIELDVQTPESEGHASQWHLLLGHETILNILDRLFPRWQYPANYDPRTDRHPPMFVVRGACYGTSGARLGLLASLKLAEETGKP